MLPERFTEAWVNRRHKVLGRRLRPYSLWHRLALEVIESPFARPDGLPSIGDLVMAVRVCRSRYPSQDAAGVFASLGQPLRYHQRLAAAILPAMFQPEAEGAKFVRYVQDFQSIPEFWQGQGSDPITSGAPPEILAVATQLIAGGFTEDQAWMMPIGQAYWYAAVLARQAGVKILFVSETPELFDGLRRLIELLKAGKLRFEQKGVIYTP